MKKLLIRLDTFILRGFQAIAKKIHATTGWDHLMISKIFFIAFLLIIPTPILLVFKLNAGLETFSDMIIGMQNLKLYVVIVALGVLLFVKKKDSTYLQEQWKLRLLMFGMPTAWLILFLLQWGTFSSMKDPLATKALINGANCLGYTALVFFVYFIACKPVQEKQT